MSVKYIENNDVLVFKLLSGEELVARVSDAYVEDCVEISRPLTLMPTREGTLSMMHSMFGAHNSEPIQLAKSGIVMTALPKPEVFDAYIEATSGIKPASSRILMG